MPNLSVLRGRRLRQARQGTSNSNQDVNDDDDDVVETAASTATCIDLTADTTAEEIIDLTRSHGIMDSPVVVLTEADDIGNMDSNNSWSNYVSDRPMRTRRGSSRLGRRRSNSGRRVQRRSTRNTTSPVTPPAAAAVHILPSDDSDSDTELPDVPFAVPTPKLLRSHLPEEHTIVIKVDKTDLPAFEKMKQIEDIIKAPIFKVSYAPVYTCTMNAKYDALEKALPHVTTKYIAWMDIGLFRGFDMESPLFKLKPPPRFNDSNIGVSEVTPREEVEGLSPQDIYIKNIVWVAGGYILADKKILPDFISAYRKAVDELLALRLADTDQQVIGSMYSPYMVKSQKIFLEPYHCPRGSFGLFGHGYLYFCLPYICKESAECKSKYFSNTENHTEKLGRVLAS